MMEYIDRDTVARQHVRALAVVALVTLLGRVAWATEQAPPPPAPPAEAVPAEGPAAPKLSTAQIEQLVAPIALYPDALTVQILMASTYPLEIVEAARWRAKNKSLEGDALDKALANEDWDQSVQSMTRFPDVLQRMSDNLDWTKDLGDAFLGQKDETLDAVQRMRAKAYESGALKTTDQQVVTREVVKDTETHTEKEIIRVEPADPQVVYVPQYSPEAVYGAPPAAPYYPSMYAYPPGYVATTSLLSFGVGMAVGAAVWGGDCDWDSHDVYHDGGGGGGNNNSNNNVNINKEKNVDRSRERNSERTRNEGGRGERGGRGEGGRRGEGGGGRQKWEHNPSHRGGVRYRDQASAKKYGGRDQVAARDRANRDTARGYDRGQGANTRPGGGRQDAAARPGGGRGDGGQPGRGGQRPGASQQPANRPGGGGQRPGASQQPANRPGGGGGRGNSGSGGAFGGYESGRSAREASARGASSRGGSSYAGRGGGGQRGGGGGGGGSRGGGGGGRGGGGGGRGGGGGGGRGGRR